ncbi:probable 3-hydroxyisobutyryl-CoA hydrolase 3 isoform X2 [Phaseolus vulgaris]
MAPTLNFDREQNQVLFTGNSCVKVVILNRPQKLNSLNHEMICQITSNLELYENDPLVQLVILKSNGKAFCAGGDVVSVITCSLVGHWTYAASFFKKLLTLDHLVATYKKPTVSLINGVVMGGGAGLSVPTRFRVVTEKAIFAMPEASIGHFPDVGANYFLSRLPGYFGEYLGLTGAQLDGAEIAACGLATHFVPSIKLESLENALQVLNSPNVSTISALIKTFAEKPNVREDSPFRSLEVINKCFSKETVEEIIESLEHELQIGAEKWITNALSYMRSSCPISLKIFLKLGSRAKLFHKDNKPKWEPSKLELVDEEMVNQYFGNINDVEWEHLRFSDRSNSQIASKL